MALSINYSLPSNANLKKPHWFRSLNSMIHIPENSHLNIFFFSFFLNAQNLFFFYSQFTELYSLKQIFLIGCSLLS